MLNARALVQSKLHDIEMSLRGTLRGFGMKVGRRRRIALRRGSRSWSARPDLANHRRGAAAVHEVLLRQFKSFEKRVRFMARDDADVDCRLRRVAWSDRVAHL